MQVTDEMVRVAAGAMSDKRAELQNLPLARIYEDLSKAALTAALAAMWRLRPAAEWRQDMGDVLWWKLPITEAPYVGSPIDLGVTVEAHTKLMTQVNQSEAPAIARFNVGGWPGYHTHFMPLPVPPSLEG